MCPGRGSWGTLTLMSTCSSLTPICSRPLTGGNIIAVLAGRKNTQISINSKQQLDGHFVFQFGSQAQSKERNKTRELSVSSLFVVILTGTRPAV